MPYAKPRGTLDTLPDVTPRWQWLEDKFRRIARLYQYHEIRTPMFEHTDLFVRTSGSTSDIVTKQMYTFNGRGEEGETESYTLRPEGTAPVLRAYLEEGLAATQSMTKLSYFGPYFRYEAPQKGRYRQFHQAGIEAIGSPDPALDAEVISLGQHYLQDLGVVSAGLFINSVGCPVCRPVHRQALLEFLRPIRSQLGEDSQRRFDTNPMRILDSKEERDQELTADAPVMLNFLCPECAAHFARLQNHLLDLKVDFEIDLRLVRGLDYYTKTAFEIKHPGLGAQDTILAGGRYDGFVEQLGGPPTPGIGFGSGIERVLLALEADGVNPVASGPRPDVFVATMGDAAHKRGVAILSELRKDGVPSEMSYGARSLKSQMKQADKSGARLALLIGDNELEQGAATVRWLETSVQQTVGLDHLARKLRELLASPPPLPVE